MGWFSNNSNEQTAYADGHADGRATARSGRFVHTSRRPTERPDDEARAYVIGHMDGQDSGRR
jgi:hypothetical protein